MDIEQLKIVWQSTANAPSIVETERLKTEFVRNLRRRERVFIVFLTWVFSTLFLFTGSLLYNVFFAHKIVMEKEWAIIPALAILWIFAIHFLLGFWRHKKAHSRCGDSIVNALRAALCENRLASSRARQIGLIYLLSIPALFLTVYQLRETGKMNGKEIVSMLAVFGIALAISGGWTAFHYYRKLLPQKMEFESLLRHYDLLEDNK